MLFIIYSKQRPHELLNHTSYATRFFGGEKPEKMRQRHPALFRSTVTSQRLYCVQRTPPNILCVLLLQLTINRK